MKDQLQVCVGYLDSTEIKQFALKMQAICDFKKQIRYVTIEYPASVHDARIFAECEFNRETGNFLSNGEWIAANSAYKLTSIVITPYRTNSTEGSRTQRIAFNKYISSFRVLIEHCFGLLKERFGCLKELRLKLDTPEQYKFACEWILVCCILHNIVLPTGGDDFEYELEEQSEYVEDIGGTERTNFGGDQRRQFIFESCIRREE